MIGVLVNSIYDFQKLRIQIGNRICAQFLDRISVKDGEDEEAKKDKTLKVLFASFKRITDGVAEYRKNSKLPSHNP